MKKLFYFGQLILLLPFLLTKCKKHDDKPAASCDVQQFSTVDASRFNNDTIKQPPYLFRKTYDKTGAVNTIDAFFYSISAGYHWRFKLLRSKDVLYGLNADKTSDTLFVAWYSNGRPVKAEERPAFVSNSGGQVTYAFEYDSKNRLQTFHWNSFSEPVQYDVAGNVTKVIGINYEYDLSRKSTQQFYFDLENFASFFYGFKLLCYLNEFPELTSPVNIRTKSSKEFVTTRTLVNHKFDAKGKLISYDVSVIGSPGEVRTLPITWNCDYDGQ